MRRIEALEFSTVTAMRHFSLDLGQQIAQLGSDDIISRDGSWTGSAYVESGQSIKIVENPSSTISVSLRK